VTTRTKLIVCGFAILIFSALATVLFNRLRVDVKSVDFAQFPAGPQRKQAFFNYFLPIIEAENTRIREKRERLLQVMANDGRSRRDVEWTEDIALEFGIDRFDVSNQGNWSLLMNRVDIIPPSLALAQGANESAWGMSRFSTEGNSFFGHWCFSPGCGLVPLMRDPGSNHEVAKFDSPRQSVERYAFNLNTHAAYKDLRQIRSSLRENGEALTGSKLADGLTNYSTRREKYINELKEMIRFNKLEKLDPG